MNTNNITVTPEILNRTANDLEHISNELKNCFDKITSIISVIRSNWTDSNGVEFSNRYDDEVRPKLSKYYNAIMAHSKFVGDAAKIYNETIGSIRTSVSKS